MKQKNLSIRIQNKKSLAIRTGLKAGMLIYSDPQNSIESTSNQLHHL
jgi:hypothetical protein